MRVVSSLRRLNCVGTIAGLSAALLSSCGSGSSAEQSAQTTTQSSAVPDTVAAPTSYAPVLLQTGLVATRHQRWLAFCDTTRDERYHLGRTPREVRGWLADYYERQEDDETLEPDSLRFGPRHPPLPGKLVRVVYLPNTPVAKQQRRQDMLQLLHALQSAALLPAAELRRLRALAQQHAFHSRRNLLSAAANLRRAATELRHLNVSPLERSGLLSRADAQRLRQDLAAEQFFDLMDVLPRLSGARVFARADYPAALGNYLHQLHQDVATLLPGMSISDVSYAVVPGTLSTCPGCPGIEDVVVRARIGGRPYAQRSELQYNNGKPTNPFTAVNPEHFYQLFNQFLADTRAPQRLTYVESPESRITTGVRGRFGLLRLTRPQALALDTLAEAPLSDPYALEHNFTILPTDSVTAAIRLFEGLGFFRHLPETQRRTAEQQVYQNRLTEREEVLRYFPSSVGEYTGWPEHQSWSYVRLLRVLARLSGGRFAPKRVAECCRSGDGRFGFTLGSQRYEVTLSEASDSPDPQLFRLVQRALQAQHIPGRFYAVNSELSTNPAQNRCYVFLLPAQERLIRARHLLTLYDPTALD